MTDSFDLDRRYSQTDIVLSLRFFKNRRRKITKIDDDHYVNGHPKMLLAKKEYILNPPQSTYSEN